MHRWAVAVDDARLVLADTEGLTSDPSFRHPIADPDRDVPSSVWAGFHSLLVDRNLSLRNCYRTGINIHIVCCVSRFSEQSNWSYKDGPRFLGRLFLERLHSSRRPRLLLGFCWVTQWLVALAGNRTGSAVAARGPYFTRGPLSLYRNFRSCLPPRQLMKMP